MKTMKNLITKTMFAAAAVVLAAGMASAQDLGLRAEIPFAFQAAGQTMTPGTYRVEYVGPQHMIVRLLNQDTGTSVMVLPATRQDPPKDWTKKGTAAAAFACSDAGCDLYEIWTASNGSAYRFKTPKSDETRMATIFFKNDKAD
jgi:hypothetical protein